MGLFPKTKMGITGVVVTLLGALLLVVKMNSFMPLPTFAMFGLIFGGSIISIAAFVRGDRNWVQIVLVAPIFLLALLWTIGEVAFPH